MNILVVDGQGGAMGRQLVEGIKKAFPAYEVTAVGTNSLATSSMIKAGADHAATGENAVVVGCREADIIAGPVGIVIADSLYGEISPMIAAAIGQSSAQKLLLPINHCRNIIVGVENFSVTQLVKEVVSQIQQISQE